MVASGSVAAIGNFDGVHRGHLHLLEHAKSLAAKNGAPLGVILFNPHPRRYFRPQDPPFLITSSRQRDALLREAGVEEIFALSFDDNLVRLSPEVFFERILASELSLRGIVAGSDFRFGQGRAGDASTLQSLATRHGMDSKIVDLLARSDDDAKFGSTDIRHAIAAGKMRDAAFMLGRPWSVEGRVEEGQKRGRTIGFPTANLTLGEIIEPRFGVYATRVIVDGVALGAVSNYGRRPTVGAPAPLLETHIFDFDADIYSRPVRVEFIEFIRDEQKFDDFDALKAQIERDSEIARGILARP